MSRRSYSQSLTNEGAFLNGKLVWANPTPGKWSNLNVVQSGGQVWVNGELVYDDNEANPDTACSPTKGSQRVTIGGGGHDKLHWAGALSKLFLTLSNFIVCWPMLCCVYESDEILLALACALSALHHMGEVRYYKPAIVDFSPRLRWWFWNGDLTGATVAILGLGSVELLRHEWLLVTVALLLMLGSEAVMYTRRSIEWQIDARTLLHTAWHLLSLGWIAWLAVTQYAHEERLYQTLFALLSQ